MSAIKEVFALFERARGPEKDGYKNSLLIMIKYEKQKALNVQRLVDGRHIFLDQVEAMREYGDLMEIEKQVLGEPDYAEMIERIKHSTIQLRHAKAFCKMTDRENMPGLVFRR